ncbi:MAG: carbohydrate binding domain-containing protein [Mucilaginibacter sp.]
MKFYKIIFCAVVSLFITTGAMAQKNMITNGGFEDDLYGWNNNGAQLTPYDFKSGKNSCAIVTPGTDKWVGIDQTVRIPKKAHNIEVSAWLKTLNVIKGKNDWDGAVFTVVFLDAGDKETGEGVNIAKLTGDQEWTVFKKTMKIPDRAVSFKILAAMANASGTMLIDEVKAVMVD